MARARSSDIRDRLTSLISPQLIRRRGRRLGVVRRHRKVDVVALVYTLLCGFDRGEKRTMASLRRAYIAATGTSLVASAFYDRFTPALAALLRELVTHAFEKLSRAEQRLAGTFDKFCKVFISDGSVIRLDDVLAEHFPSAWTNHTKASAKLHLTIDAATRTPTIVQIVPGSQHDVSLLSPGTWCRGALMVFDLAYYDGKLFQRILDHGGYFLCRVKKDANFLVVDPSVPQFDGRRHPEVVRASHGRSFDIRIEHVYRNARKRDWTKHSMQLRLVGVWDPEAQSHHLFITSAPAQLLALDAVSPVYAIRWEIELLFRELKRIIRIDDMPSGNRAAVQCLIYAALLSLAVSRCLAAAVDATDRAPTERTTAVVRTLAPLLLELLLAPPPLRSRIDRLAFVVLRREALDPNRRRRLLRHRAVAGVLNSEKAATP